MDDFDVGAVCEHGVDERRETQQMSFASIPLGELRKPNVPEAPVFVKITGPESKSHKSNQKIVFMVSLVHETSRWPAL